MFPFKLIQKERLNTESQRNDGFHVIVDQVIAGLWIVSSIGSCCNFLTLVYTCKLLTTTTHNLNSFDKLFFI